MTNSKWPWKRQEDLIADVSNLRAIVDGHASSILSNLRALLNRQTEPPAFVSVLVAGTSEGKSVFMGRSVDVKDRSIIEIGPTMRPLEDVTIIVFADLRCVDVRGIFAGIDLLQSSVGECPIAKMGWTLLPGIKINVMCELRKKVVI